MYAVKTLKKKSKKKKLLEAAVLYLGLVIQKILHKLRNTNTKIFLDYADDVVRELGGKSICSSTKK